MAVDLNPVSKRSLQARRRSGVGASFFLSQTSTKSKTQSGQAMVEYVLLLAIIAGVAFGFLRTFSSMSQEGILHFNAQLEKELSTGDGQGLFQEKYRVWRVSE